MRVLKMLSRQLRNGNALSSALSVSLTAPAEANGPKYSVSGALGAAMLADQRELVVRGAGRCRGSSCRRAGRC